MSADLLGSIPEKFCAARVAIMKGNSQRQLPMQPHSLGRTRATHSTNIDAIGTFKTWQISKSFAAVIRFVPFSYF